MKPFFASLSPQSVTAHCEAGHAFDFDCNSETEKTSYSRNAHFATSRIELVPVL